MWSRTETIFVRMRMGEVPLLILSESDLEQLTRLIPNIIFH